MIDRYITEQIKRRGITPYDITGDKYIDPTPEIKDQPASQRARWNKFSSLSGYLRFCELLTDRDFDPYFPCNNLAIPIKDLVRYWWDNLVDQESVIADIFEDLLTLYKDRMLPEEPEEVPADISDAFEDIVGRLEDYPLRKSMSE